MTEALPQILDEDQLYHSVMLDKWEDDIVWGDDDEIT